MFVDVTSKDNKYKENKKVTYQKRNRTIWHMNCHAADDDS
jgi:hypothetical protein